MGGGDVSNEINLQYRGITIENYSVGCYKKVIYPLLTRALGKRRDFFAEYNDRIDYRQPE